MLSRRSSSLAEETIAGTTAAGMGLGFTGAAMPGAAASAGAAEPDVMAGMAAQVLAGTVLEVAAIMAQRHIGHLVSPAVHFVARSANYRSHIKLRESRLLGQEEDRFIVVQPPHCGELPIDPCIVREMLQRNEA